MKFLCRIASNAVFVIIGFFFEQYIGIFLPFKPDLKYFNIRPMDVLVHHGLLGLYMILCLLPLILLFFLPHECVSIIEVCVMTTSAVSFQWLREKILDWALAETEKQMADEARKNA